MGFCLLLSPWFLTVIRQYSSIRSRAWRKKVMKRLLSNKSKFFFSKPRPLWTCCKAAGSSACVPSRILFFHWYVLYTFWTISAGPHWMFLNTSHYFPAERFLRLRVKVTAHRYGEEFVKDWGSKPFTVKVLYYTFKKETSTVDGSLTVLQGHEYTRKM